MQPQDYSRDELLNDKIRHALTFASATARALYDALNLLDAEKGEAQEGTA